MTTFSIQHANQIINGLAYKVQANHLIDNFNGIISNFGDVLNLYTTNTQNVLGPVTFASSVSLSGGISGTLNFSALPTSAQITPTASNQVATKNYVDTTVASTPSNAAYGTAPVYLSPSTLIINSYTGRDSTNALFINVPNSNASLTGTVSGSAGSATLTGVGTLFTTQLQQGDFIWLAAGSGQPLQIVQVQSIASATSLTLTANLTYSVASGTTFSYPGTRIDLKTPNTLNGVAQASATNTGTVTFTRASTTVTGTTTTFLTQYNVGDVITVPTVTTGNLSGTVSCTGGTAAVTGSSTTFNTDFCIGDIINFAGGQSGVVASITSNTALTLQSNLTTTVSGVNYTGQGPQSYSIAAIASNTSLTLSQAARRTATNTTHTWGGWAPVTFYYLYAIIQNTLSGAGFILTTNNAAGGQSLVNLPTGYTYYRQMAFALLTDAYGNIQPFAVETGWPSRPLIRYINATYGAAPFNLLTSGTASTFTAVSTASIQPPISKELTTIGFSNSITGGAVTVYVRPTNSGLLIGRGIMPSINTGYGPGEAVITTNGSSFDYKLFSSSALALDATGYIVTEVP